MREFKDGSKKIDGVSLYMNKSGGINIRISQSETIYVNKGDETYKKLKERFDQE